MHAHVRIFMRTCVAAAQSISLWRRHPSTSTPQPSNHLPFACLRTTHHTCCECVQSKAIACTAHARNACVRESEWVAESMVYSGVVHVRFVCVCGCKVATLPSLRCTQHIYTAGAHTCAMGVQQAHRIVTMLLLMCDHFAYMDMAR